MLPLNRYTILQESKTREEFDNTPKYPAIQLSTLTIYNSLYLAKERELILVQEPTMRVKVFAHYRIIPKVKVKQGPSLELTALTWAFVLIFVQPWVDNCSALIQTCPSEENSEFLIPFCRIQWLM